MSTLFNVLEYNIAGVHRHCWW